MERKQNKTEKSTNVGGTLNGGWGYFYCHLNAYLLKKVVMGGGGLNSFTKLTVSLFSNEVSLVTPAPPPPLQDSLIDRRRSFQLAIYNYIYVYVSRLTLVSW